MPVTNDIANLIEATVRQELSDSAIQSVRVVEARGHDDDPLLRITVVHDRKGALDPRKTMAITRRIRDQLEAAISGSPFPIVSFISKSDAASLKPEAA